MHLHRWCQRRIGAHPPISAFSETEDSENPALGTKFGCKHISRDGRCQRLSGRAPRALDVRHVLHRAMDSGAVLFPDDEGQKNSPAP